MGPQLYAISAPTSAKAAMNLRESQLNHTEIKIAINELTVNKLKFMLENDYKDFEVWVSDNIDTIKIKSKTDQNLPVIVIGQYEKYQHSP